MGSNGDQGSPVVTEPQVSPTRREGAKRLTRPPAAAILACLVVAATALLWALGVLDPPPGPDPDDVEGQIALDAVDFGVAASIQCPDSASETEVGGTFDCVATTNDGRSVTITVINGEETYRWNPQPLARLRRGPP